jgi:cell division transport system permease protein
VSLLQALRYFFREAAVNLLRGWKVSLLAVLTIAVSLGLGGTFLLAGRNLGGAVERWRSQSRVVVYLRSETTDADLRRLAAEATAAPWVAGVEAVTAAEARRRFRDIFPSLAGLVEGWESEPLPASLEIALHDPGKTRPPALESWLAAWRRRPEVTLLDDDREWLSQLETMIAVLRAVGLTLGGILLGGAIFTIASVIRLTAYLHREEISILRLVGATEFYIRGPFYAEGLLQGLIGGGLAIGALYAAFRLVQRQAASSHLASLLASDFLAPRQLVLLATVGALAGLAGAVASLRREAL